MATNDSIRYLNNVLRRLQEIDEVSLIRKNLGDESLEKEFSPVLEEIHDKANFSRLYHVGVPSKSLSQVADSFKHIIDQCVDQSQRNNQEFITNKQGFLKRVQNELDEIGFYWPSFVTTAVVKRGLLDDKSIQIEQEEILDRLRKQSASNLEELQRQSDKNISDAKKLAESIESRARQTAEKISVKEAQNQFKEAQAPLIVQLTIWGTLSVGSIIVFFMLVDNFLKIELESNWTWQIVYYTGIRLTALTAVASIAAYCMRILRSQLHMFQRNQHRRRVANCIEALVQSASTPEQRDFIYAQLVESITKFGDTGLLQIGEGDDSNSKLTIDNITRSITTPKDS